jgi:hypothetical protein
VGFSAGNFLAQKADYSDEIVPFQRLNSFSEVGLWADFERRLEQYFLIEYLLHG